MRIKLDSVVLRVLDVILNNSLPRRRSFSTDRAEKEAGLGVLHTSSPFQSSDQVESSQMRLRDPDQTHGDHGQNGVGDKK